MVHHNNPVKVALAAYGMSGRVFHGPLLSHHQGFKLEKILERSGQGLSKEKYPDTIRVADFQEILTDPTIELVIINTPEHTHYELGRQALLSGKHVVIEKAFTVTSQEAQTLVDLAKDKGKMLSVFQNSRWHGDFITIQQIIDKKLLGQLVELEIHFDRYRKLIQPGTWKEEPKPGTGSLYNLGSHIIDQSLVLFGRPHSLWADVGIQRPGGKVVDYFEVVLWYEKQDLKVTLKSSYLVRELGPRYLLHGTEGSYVKYGGDPQEAWLKAGKSPWEEGYGYEPHDQWGQLNAGVDDLHFEGKIETCQGSYMGFYDNIHGVIRHDEELIVKPEQATDTIKIIEAAMKSSEEKRGLSLTF